MPGRDAYYMAASLSIEGRLERGRRAGRNHNTDYRAGVAEPVRDAVVVSTAA